MEENAQHRTTGLQKPTTRIPQFSTSVSNGSGLHEMTNSQTNMRQPASLMPASNSSLKRGVPTPAVQSDAKRKPLSKRAGEFPDKPISTSHLPSQNIKGVSLRDTARPGAPGSRHTSTSSYSSNNSNYTMSVGSGVRPPSRSQIAHSRARSTTRLGRPATSMGTREGTRQETREEVQQQGNNVSEIEEKIQSMDTEFQRLREFMNSTEKNSVNVKEELEMAKKRVAALEDQRSDLQAEKSKAMDRLADADRQIRILTLDIEDQQRRHEKYCEDLVLDHERMMRAKVDDYEREMDKAVKIQREFEDKCGAQAEARLENLSRENKELRSNFEFQKRDHERELHRLNIDIERQSLRMKEFEESLKKSEEEQKALQATIDENLKTIDRLRKRAEDAEESLSKDKGHLGGQISLLSQKLDFSSERIQSLEEHNKAVQLECEKKMQEMQLSAQKRIDEETRLLRDRLIKEEERRHKLFEQVQELKGNIRVMCRIKPPSDPEGDALIKFNPRASELDEDKIDGLLIPTEREDFREPGKMIPGKPKEFNFERVFDDQCTNKDVFDEISQLVQSVMDGKKVCIFCYGQTGSGKTFTMSRKGDGIIPRTQDMIFGEVERLKALGWEYTVEGSYLEVYQDKLYDLLASRSAKPEPLSVDPISEELNIKGHSFTLLQEQKDLDEMVRTADNNRHTAATAMNDRSSRSHSILVLKIIGTKKNEEGEIIKTRKGTLNLIDLAGSESPDKTRSEQIYREGVEINSSLSYLRTVLASLGQGKTEGIDFRSYTLTQLLRPSLGKGCRTLMFVMVSPLKVNENETVRSLEFARDAQKVKMGGAKGKK
ncbi:kinesin-domain-containing protein [Annulohypoxylon maeteangense]|uniref:kinesin-domain-containing protein n=1 Tax=Annulohypoxylon maeteangense TaxID=1927788 RepID=UPI00200726C4|nr:kinesin-domain-containing protein [Annulohypoxylon maeteangense]KAI0884156.1 kinesin-domain-containing protein [Annulohypoxylon maeteangense]